MGNPWKHESLIDSDDEDAIRYGPIKKETHHLSPISAPTKLRHDSLSATSTASTDSTPSNPSTRSSTDRPTQAIRPLWPPSETNNYLGFCKRDSALHFNSNAPRGIFCCVFCCAMAQGSTQVYGNLDIFMAHLAKYHWAVEREALAVLPSMRCVVGRVAPDSEYFDVNILPPRGWCLGYYVAWGYFSIWYRLYLFSFFNFLGVVYIEKLICS